MMKFIICLVFLVFAATNTFAQEANDAGMRDLAVTQMFEYGKSIYERGDKQEATNVFKRILELNANYAPAQEYARRLGIIAPKPQPVIQVKKIAIVPPAPVIVKPMDPNQDLRDAIADEDAQIAQLMADIANLRIVTGAKCHE